MKWQRSKEFRASRCLSKAASTPAGVLKHKKRAEEKLIASGLPYTILRPGRLTDGPYTSYDLNTLLKASSGARQDVQISPADDQRDEASRIAVAGSLPQIDDLVEAASSISSANLVPRKHCEKASKQNCAACRGHRPVPPN